MKLPHLRMGEASGYVLIGNSPMTQFTPEASENLTVSIKIFNRFLYDIRLEKSKQNILVFNKITLMNPVKQTNHENGRIV